MEIMGICRGLRVSSYEGVSLKVKFYKIKIDFFSALYNKDDFNSASE